VLDLLQFPPAHRKIHSILCMLAAQPKQQQGGCVNSRQPSPGMLGFIQESNGQKAHADWLSDKSIRE